MIMLRYAISALQYVQNVLDLTQLPNALHVVQEFSNLAMVATNSVLRAIMEINQPILANVSSCL